MPCLNKKNRKNIPLRYKISCGIFSTIGGPVVCLNNVFHLYIRTCVSTSCSVKNSGGTFLHFEFWLLNYFVSIFQFFRSHCLKWCSYLASYIFMQLLFNTIIECTWQVCLHSLICFNICVKCVYQHSDSRICTWHFRSMCSGMLPSRLPPSDTLWDHRPTTCLVN